MRLLRLTLRTSIRHEQEVLALDGEGQHLICAMWHGDMIMAPEAYRSLRKRGLKRVAILASLSRDGETLARAVRRMGFDTVRGSSSRGARSGLKAMQRYLETTGHVVVAVDGPRGPFHQAKLGVALLARNAGSRIVPMTLAYSRSWRLRSWDRTAIPLPFSRCTITLHPTIAVPPDADRDELERIRALVERTLLDAAGNTPE